MKKSFTFLISALLMGLTFQVQAQNTLYPGVTDTSRVYQAPKTSTPPVIDGNPTDAAWALAPWQQAFAVSTANDWGTETPAGKEGPFSGAEDVSFKYKFIWDDNHFYWLLRWTDDEVIYNDNHNGYRVGSVPAYATATATVPAAGAGDGKIGRAHV